MRVVTSMALFFTVAGCAGVDLADCGSDWYAIGQRDGRLGAQGQEELYVGRCGSKVDAARYRDGWRDGFGRRPRPVV